MKPGEREIVNAFHRLYFDGPEGAGRVQHRTFWRGVQCLKCPLDLWAYQEILHDVKPDLVVETGTHRGGSALFLADMLELAGRGEVITIDILENDSRPRHPRIRYVTASSTDQSRIRPLLDARPPGETRLVVLDSDHSKAHVAGELALYAPYVSVGSYLIVEDTNVNGRPVLPDFGPGPAEAVADFLAASRAFVADTAREKSLLTFNPGGYLKRIA
jgi:cephalosporin hydroxylase